MWHILYSMGSLGHTNGHCFVALKSQPRSQSFHLVAPPALLASGIALRGRCGRELQFVCQGHIWGPRIPSLLGVQIWKKGLLCPRPHNLGEGEAPTEFWKQVPKKGLVCARPGLAPDSFAPSLLSAEAPSQCPALAPQALGSHAALLPPVAFHCPVALQTVSDPEKVTLSGVSAAKGRGCGPLSCCALSLPGV